MNETDRHRDGDGDDYIDNLHNGDTIENAADNQNVDNNRNRRPINRSNRSNRRIRNNGNNNSNNNDRAFRVSNDNNNNAASQTNSNQTEFSVNHGSNTPIGNTALIPTNGISSDAGDNILNGTVILDDNQNTAPGGSSNQANIESQLTLNDTNRPRLRENQRSANRNNNRPRRNNTNFRSSNEGRSNRRNGNRNNPSQGRTRRGGGNRNQRGTTRSSEATEEAATTRTALQSLTDDRNKEVTHHHDNPLSENIVTLSNVDDVDIVSSDDVVTNMATECSENFCQVKPTSSMLLTPRATATVANVVTPDTTTTFNVNDINDETITSNDNAPGIIVDSNNNISDNKDAATGLPTADSVTPMNSDLSSHDAKSDHVRLDEQVHSVEEHDSIPSKICESSPIADSFQPFETYVERLCHSLGIATAGDLTATEGGETVVSEHPSDDQQQLKENGDETVDDIKEGENASPLRDHNDDHSNPDSRQQQEELRHRMRIDHRNRYQRNMKRCNDIVDCNNQLTTLKRRLNILKQEQTKQQLMATLTICKNRRNISVWNALSRKEKWKKPYILLMLQCASVSSHPIDKRKLLSSYSYHHSLSSSSSTVTVEYSHSPKTLLNHPQWQEQMNGQLDSDSKQQKKKFDYHLPKELLEPAFEKMVPNKLRCDRDVFLARISTWSFREYYNKHHFHHDPNDKNNENDNDRDISNRISQDKNSSSRSPNDNKTRKAQQQHFLDPNGQKIAATANQRHQMQSDNYLLPPTLTIPELFWDDDLVMKSVVHYLPELLLWLRSHKASTSGNTQGKDDAHSEINLDIKNNDNSNKSKRRKNQKSRNKNSIPVTSSSSSVSSLPNTPVFISNNPVGIFPERFWSDVDLFTHFIQSPHMSKNVIESLPDIIGKFDQNVIGNNSQLMLWAISRSSKCFTILHESLRNNKDFTMQALEVMKNQVPNHFLSDCSMDIRSDIDVVLAVVKRNGLNLQYASKGLRRHHAVIMAACKNNPRAFAYSLPSNYSPKARQKLQKDKGFWINTIFSAIASESSTDSSRIVFGTPYELFDATIYAPVETSQSSGFMTFATRKITVKSEIADELWKLVDVSLKHDIDVVLAAVKAECLSISEAKTKVNNGNAKFWIDLLNHDSEYLWDMPTSLLLTDPNILLKGIVKIKDELTIRGAFHREPLLRENRSFWLTIVRSVPAPTNSFEDPVLVDSTSLMQESALIDTCSFSSDLSVSVLCDIFHLAPASILSDKEIMVEACLRDYQIFELLDTPLTEDYDILKAMITCTPEALHMINPWQQHQYPELVRIAILSLKQEDMWDIFECIDDGIWASNRSIAVAWLSRGGDYLHDEFPSSYENDPEMFLHIAKHNPHDFWCASEALCSNKEFMLQVVEINGQLLCEAWGNLSKDYDLAVVAFSSTPDLCSRYDANDNDDFMFLISFAKYVRERIQEHDNFIQILCGITLSTSESIPSDGDSNVLQHRQCYLHLLDQGTETSLEYKKLLAEFIGLPSGDQLKQLRQASINLSVWGY